MEAGQITSDVLSVNAEARASDKAVRRGSGPGHMTQLDGLRTLAVAAVAWHHWMHLRSYGIPFGPLGVQLFFVLSGFLITGILLDARSKSESGGDKWFVLRQFYLRRFLRIFPLFYLTIAIGLLVNLPPFRETWLWHVTYTSNIYFFLRGAWNGHVGHFWSLSVEEQFYLCWPFLMLFSPRRFLPAIVIAAVAFAPAFRIVVPVFHPDNDFTRYLTPSCFDCLGIGALLALATRSPGGWSPLKIARVLLVIGIVGGAISVGFRFAQPLGQTFAAFAFGWLVYSAAIGFGGPFGAFLQWSPVVYLGRISYGIYILHVFSLDALSYGINHLHLPAALEDHGVFRLPMLTVITIGAAALSWHLYEKPLNDLKRHFPYMRKNAEPEPART